LGIFLNLEHYAGYSHLYAYIFQKEKVVMNGDFYQIRVCDSIFEMSRLTSIGGCLVQLLPSPWRQYKLKLIAAA
jgi:hypothetical protein